MAEDKDGAGRLEQAVETLEGAVGGLAQRLKQVESLEARNAQLERELAQIRTAQDAVAARLDKTIAQLKSVLAS